MMQRFFDRPDTHWPRLTGALHIYIVPRPTDSAVTRQRGYRDDLRALPGLAVQPEDGIHSTVQRLDAYEEAIDDPRWDAFEASLARRLGEVRAFQLTFDPPTPRLNAVEASAPERAGWDRLVEAVRSAAEEADLGHLLTEPPYGPHYTVAYCVDPTDDAAASAALSGAGRTQMTVDEVALVGVTQDRGEGVFTYDVIRRWPLASAVRTLI